MVTLLVLLFGALLIILVWILVSSVVLTIDTKNQDYSIRLFGLLKAGIEGHEQAVKLYFNAPFYHKSMDLETMVLKQISQKRKRPPKPVSKKPAKRSRFNRKTLHRFWRILRSFRIKKCYLNIDTSDVVLNGQLYPIAQLIRSRGHSVHINFLGQRDVVFVVQNSLARMILAFIKS